jgi:signal peptidase I
MKSYPIQVLFREYFEGILAATFLALFLRFFIVSILYMPSTNMEPGLVPGDFIIGWRISYGFPLPLMKGERINQKLPRRGDMVSLRFPGDEEQLLLRRVIGLPGDKVSIKRGQLFVNGYPAQIEPNLESLPGARTSYAVKGGMGESDMAAVEVPPASLFVLSDNRDQADDSRSWGMVPLSHIESRLSFVWLSVDNSGQRLRIRWERILQKVQ